MITTPPTPYDAPLAELRAEQKAHGPCACGWMKLSERTSIILEAKQESYMQCLQDFDGITPDQARAMLGALEGARDALMLNGLSIPRIHSVLASINATRPSLK